MAGNIQIEVGADIRQAVTGLKQVEVQGKKTFTTVSREAANMARTAAVAGGSISKTSKDFTGLSRVIQDLPFGFIGISNNLTQLIPAAGAAGLAFSALISAITFAQTGFSNWTRGMGSAKEETDKAKKKIEETKERVAELTKAFSDIKIDISAQVAGDTDGEVIKVQTLARVVSDVTKSYNERNRALSELKEINKSYFGDITLESDKLSTLTARVNEYSKALVAAAVVKAFEGKIGEVAVQLSEQGDKLKELRTQLNAIAGDYQLVGKKAQGFRLLTPEQNLQAEKLRIQIKEQEPIVNALANTYKKLQASIESAVLETLNFKPLSDEKTDTKKVKDKTKEIEDELNERKRILTEFQKDFATIGVFNVPQLSKNLEDFSTTDDLTAELRDKLQKALLNLPKKLETAPIKVPVPVKPTIVNTATIDAAAKKLADDINRIFNDALSEISVEGLSSIGESIGAALTGDGIAEAFQEFGKMLGSAVIALGKQIIALNIAALAAKKALKLTFANPAVGIAAGIGLVAVGAALKNLLSGGIKGFAQGGLVYGPTLGLIGEGIGTTRNNPEVIAPLDKLQKIIGGTAAQNIRVTVDGGWRGNEFVLGLARVLQSQGRNFGRGSLG